MEDTTVRIARFSSCRGVAFEINPNKINLFAIEPPPHAEQPNVRYWLPWAHMGSHRLYPWDTNPTNQSRSLKSSHFCDIDLEECEIEVEIIEDGKDVEKVQEKAYCDKVQKPEAKTSPARNSRVSTIVLGQGFFNVYNFLFLVCLTFNLVALSLSAAGHLEYAKRKAALFSICNIMASTLCRSEAVFRVIFWLTVKLFGRPWVPLQIKIALTSFLQSLGGIHSGCGTCSIAWLVYAITLTLTNKESSSPEIISLAFAILTLISISCIAAFPLIRHLHHNIFERIHRFAGWLSLILVWLFILLSASYDTFSRTYALHFSSLCKWQEFWFTLAITYIIISPWLTVRKVPVKVFAPSCHASIIKFEGGVKAGLIGRISPSPLSEWHAFGIISDGKKEHIMLAGSVGDFTKSLISNPPSHLWVRTIHFAGLPYLVNLYQRVVLVATGSGIAVFLSFLLQPCQANVCLLWVAKGIEMNYGKEIKELISRGGQRDNVIVHDTAISGRPNVAELSVDVARKWEAEVVVVTSNPEGTRDVVRVCKKAGIPAFGPIWDS